MAVAQPNRIALAWTPIPYTWDGGTYEVSVATTPGGPYTVHGTTADKAAAGYEAGGLTPETDYYFVVRTYTPAHSGQQNELWSEYTTEVFTATTPMPPCGVTEIPAPNVRRWWRSTIHRWGHLDDHTGWLPATTPCSWYGVTCEGGNVIRLTLDAPTERESSRRS